MVTGYGSYGGYCFLVAADRFPVGWETAQSKAKEWYIYFPILGSFEVLWDFGWPVWYWRQTDTLSGILIKSGNAILISRLGRLDYGIVGKSLSVRSIIVLRTEPLDIHGRTLPQWLPLCTALGFNFSLCYFQQSRHRKGDYVFVQLESEEMQLQIRPI